MGGKILYTPIDFILSHFEGQLQLFPRKMMTDKVSWQFTVTSREEILERCKESNFVDCRINAYPEYTEYDGIVRQAPDFIFVDLDLPNFDYDKSKMDRILKGTLNKIYRIGEVKPTVLWSDNGYHIYLPIKAMALDTIDIFAKDNFPSLFGSLSSKYDGYSVSELFVKFTKEYFTNGKSDSQHKPKYKSCLIRFPETYNSKCLNRGLSKEESKVKIIQEWDGKRMPIQLLLRDFRIWITQLEINHRKKLEKPIKNTFNPINNQKLEWIENPLQTPLADHRKYCLWLILGPYLLNVRKLKDEQASQVMEEWLQKCDKIRKLDFRLRDKIQPIIRGNKSYLPISFVKIKEENENLYTILNLKHNLRIF